jgi:hypothetical protein
MVMIDVAFLGRNIYPARKNVGRSRSTQSDAAVEQMLEYVEMSKMVMDLICEGLDRLNVKTANKKDCSRTKWWQNP